MLFGSPEEFAIEAVLEPGPVFAPLQGNNLTGRIRVWMGGEAIGRFDEPCCWLGPPCDHLAEVAAGVDGLWDVSFNGLDPAAIFDRLDNLLFGGHRHQRIEVDSSEDSGAAQSGEPNFGRFIFLLNASEAFDGWKAFLVRPADSSLLAIVLARNSSAVRAFRFSLEAYRHAVHGFAMWLDENERTLLPHLARTSRS